MATYDDFASIKNIVSRYANDISQQFNLGWSVIRWYYILLFAIGIVTLVAVHAIFAIDGQYKDNSKSKVPLSIVCFVAIAVVIFAVWSTIARFYEIVKRINEVSEDPASLFTTIETGPTSVIERVVANAILPGQVRRTVAEKLRESQGPKASPPRLSQIPKPVSAATVSSAEVKADVAPKETLAGLLLSK
jgi:hypothetical protein